MSSELIVGLVLGAIAVGIAGLYAIARKVMAGIDALRSEIAMARIEGILGSRPDGNGGGGERPVLGRRKRHLGVVSAMAGVAVGAAAWMRDHRAASMSLAAAAAAVAIAATLMADGGGTRQGEGPAGQEPTATVTTSFLPTATSSSTSAAPTTPQLSPSPSARPPVRATDRRPATTVALPRPTGPGLTLPPEVPSASPSPSPTTPEAPSPTTTSPTPSRPPGRDPHCLRLELLDLVDAGTCVSL
jgi:hypothetical protein